jgi:hypothetical protein
MKSIKIIGIFGLITGIAGLSHAGFKDALKSAAGSALNQVAGTAIVTNRISEQTTANAAKNKPKAFAANAASTEIKDCVVKDESSSFKENFMKANAFSEDEYSQWLSEVTKQLAANWTPVPGIPAEGVVFNNRRITLSADEAGKVFCIAGNSGILLAQECAYFLSGNTCIKFNYTTLVTGICDERGDVLRNPEASRVIYIIEKCCYSAKEKISNEKYERAQLVAGIESQKRFTAEMEKQKQQIKEEEDRLAEIRAKEAAVAAQEEEKRARQIEEEMAWQTEQKAKQEVAAAQELDKRNKQIQAILTWDDTPAKTRAASKKNKTIVFKSLYLGMPIEDALHILYRELGAANKPMLIFPPQILTSSEANSFLVPCGISAPVEENYYSVIMIISDSGAKLLGLLEATPDRNLIGIVLEGPIVDELFNASGLETSTFVKQFSDSYGVKMDISDDWQSWVCTKADGAKISINSYKAITLEKVASKQKIKKAFN